MVTIKVGQENFASWCYIIGRVFSNTPTVNADHKRTIPIQSMTIP